MTINTINCEPALEGAVRYCWNEGEGAKRLPESGALLDGAIRRGLGTMVPPTQEYTIVTTKSTAVRYESRFFLGWKSLCRTQNVITTCQEIRTSTLAAPAWHNAPHSSDVQWPIAGPHAGNSEKLREKNKVAWIGRV